MYFYHVMFPLAINGGFVYRFEKRLRLGSRVLVDFKGSTRVGVVWSESDRPKYETKPIIGQLDSFPILSSELLDTLKFFAFYYLSYEGLLLRSALPKRVFEMKDSLNLEKVSPIFAIQRREFELTEEQRKALESIELDFFKVNLLFGVTGSGKTEIYLRLIERVLKQGKKVVILVPEIALTPQYIGLFSDRFSKDSISVIHSRLTKKEKFENWLNFERGKAPILVGTRSAIFVSFRDVGLVVVDEENDESYKQENQPTYNAKDVAIYRSNRNNIPIILSSATPSLESLYKAKEGKFNFIRLNKRVGDIELPEVKFVKIEEDELLANETIENMKSTIDKNETVAVLINRRGFARYLLCEDCGYVFKCPNCSVSLFYHKEDKSLKCHWCDSTFDLPEVCPKCGSPSLIDRGTGSQKVEEELRKTFPNASIQRFDRDVTSRRGEFERIIKNLHSGKIDILVGTQMLSKGHDVSKITLVVISDFESMFSIPDFRAFEKGISLIIQTAGRSGRRDKGSVIIQSKAPLPYLSEYIINHDYHAFFEEEIKTRKLFNYPPFCRLIRIVSSSVKVQRSRNLIEEVYEKLKNRFVVIGPSKCPIFKLRNRYRYHLIVKTNSMLKTVEFLRREIMNINGLYFDVDPISFF